MPADMPPAVPQAVVKFVEKSEWNKVYPSGTWHQYRVYYVDPNLPNDGKIYYIGMPTYVLYDGKIVRYASPDETLPIMGRHKSGPVIKSIK